VQVNTYKFILIQNALLFLNLKMLYSWRISHANACFHGRAACIVNLHQHINIDFDLPLHRILSENSSRNFISSIELNLVCYRVVVFSFVMSFSGRLQSPVMAKCCRIFWQWCESQRMCGRLKLSDLLVKPWQRLTRYKLLLYAMRTPLDKMDSSDPMIEDQISAIDAAVCCFIVFVFDVETCWDIVFH